MTAVPSPRAYSLRIFLADGTPEGLRVVEKTNWSGVGLMFPKARWVGVRERDLFARPGVYVLIGPSDGGALRYRIYVGEADDLRTRLNQQAAARDFWTRAIAFTSKDDDLNKAHVRYLEARLIERARHAKRSDIENGNAPTPPKLSEPETAFADAFLDDMLLIYPVLGLDTFELADTAAVLPAAVLRLQGKDASARGASTSEGFIVYAGATIRKLGVPSLHAFTVALREKLLVEGVLADRGDHLELTQDYVFDSPSGAAALVLGRSSNGRVEWKTPAGQTLKAVEEAEIGAGKG